MKELFDKSNLDTADTKRLEKLLTVLIKDLQQGAKIHFGDILARAAVIDGEPRCLSYKLFDAVVEIAECYPRYL